MMGEGRYLVSETRVSPDDTGVSTVSIRTLRFATAKKIFGAAQSLKGVPGFVELWDIAAGHLIAEHYRPE